MADPRARRTRTTGAPGARPGRVSAGGQGGVASRERIGKRRRSGGAGVLCSTAMRWPSATGLHRQRAHQGRGRPRNASAPNVDQDASLGDHERRRGPPCSRRSRGGSVREHPQRREAGRQHHRHDHHLPREEEGEKGEPGRASPPSMGASWWSRPASPLHWATTATSQAAAIREPHDRTPGRAAVPARGRWRSTGRRYSSPAHTKSRLQPKAASGTRTSRREKVVERVAQVVARDPLREPRVVESALVAQARVPVEHEDVERAGGPYACATRWPRRRGTGTCSRRRGPLDHPRVASSGYRCGSFELIASSWTPRGP